MKPSRLTVLLAWGFDRSTQVRPGRIRVSCSQCAAVAVNGTPCHETGCPNVKVECRECDGPADKRSRLCESCAADDGTEDDSPDLPLCVKAMGCYCAGHANEVPVDEPCDTREVRQ